MSPIVNNIASGSQELKYAFAMAKAVYLPERSWSSQFSDAMITGAASNEAATITGPAILGDKYFLALSYSEYTPKPIQIANT